MNLTTFIKKVKKKKSKSDGEPLVYLGGYPLIRKKKKPTKTT